MPGISSRVAPDAVRGRRGGGGDVAENLDLAIVRGGIQKRWAPPPGRPRSDLPFADRPISLPPPSHPCTGSHHVAQPVRDHPLRRPQLRPRRGRTLRPRQLLRSLPDKLHPGSRHLLRHAAHRPAHGRRGQARGQSRVRPHARPRRPRLRPLRQGDGQDADGLDVARRRGGEGEYFWLYLVIFGNLRTGN
jgi:hypothetical protein